MFKHILIPLDGSSFGESALGPAFALAQRATRTQVTLLSVQDLWTGAATELPYEGREAYLRQLARAHGGDASVRCVVRSGHAADQILAEAEACGADLIVMSTHGRGGVTRFWLGSVADQCLRHAGIPLLLVRPRPGEHPTSEAFRPQRIVVPLDGTTGAEAALQRAGSLARAFGIPIALIRAVGGSPSSHGRLVRIAEARAYVDKIADELERQGLSATREIFPEAHPATTILGAAAGEPIVMTTHARAPLARALLGSVADKVVRGARGIVLVVPPRGTGPLPVLPRSADERLTV